MPKRMKNTFVLPVDGGRLVKTLLTIPCFTSAKSYVWDVRERKNSMNNRVRLAMVLKKLYLQYSPERKEYFLSEEDWQTYYDLGFSDSDKHYWNDNGMREAVNPETDQYEEFLEFEGWPVFKRKLPERQKVD